MDVQERVAIVTGAGRGIGRAIALRLARAGHRMVMAELDLQSARLVQEEVEALERACLALPCDVTQTPQVEAVVDEAMARFGRIDVLVNNAGIIRDALLMRMSDRDWDAVLATNLKGAFLCTRAVLRPMLRQRWGRIVNISSIAGVMGNPGQANYSAAKAGLIGLTKTTAREVASRGITVNAVAPGFIVTGLTGGLSDKVKEGILAQIPQGRFGQPEDVAELVAFLASEEAGYITGQVVNIDGGLVT